MAEQVNIQLFCRAALRRLVYPSFSGSRTPKRFEQANTVGTSIVVVRYEERSQ